MTYYPQLIKEALSHVRYPGTGEDIVSAGMLEDDIRIDGKKISFSLIFKRTNDPFAKSLVKACEQAILTYVDKEADIKGNIAIKTITPPPTPKDDSMKGVKNIIAVSSGKGGVGKSSIAVNLAVALAQAGKRVGLLDADIYGPSVPKMLNLEDARPEGENIDGKDYILPIECLGMKVLSIGFFVDPDKALVWRGAMAVNALKQLINDTLWGELDYFIVDMPPGTGDIHLSLVQLLKLTGAIVVTTPQPVALADARKGIDMFTNEHVNVPVLGIVENMAWFTPEELPNNKYYIFGKDGGKTLAEECGVRLLAQIPLVQGIREGGDNGIPVALQPNHPAANYFKALAQSLM
ncbi:MAG: Mrp/NBP35 family ATP-binding protein [Bacteroidales bacterium]|nr:Mrp/NBP35 family ATP-binding protein [Bacteroidales bacterium]